METINETRCERTDLPAYMCSHCKGLPWVAPALDPDFDPFAAPATVCKPDPGLWFTAAYPGACSACGGDIIPGDTIRPDGGDGYECSGCAKDARQ